MKTVLKGRKIGRHEALKLPGRLAFADGFLHGRLGAFLFKRLIDHAYYSSSNNVGESLAQVLELMVQRLQTAGPKLVDVKTVAEWCVFTDASYDGTSKTGGLGAVLFGPSGDCAGGFSVNFWEL